MLVIKIELWPFGNESAKKTLAVGRIINDGSGSPSSGNYRVELEDKAGRRLLGWDLLCRALASIVGSRNKISESATKCGPESF